MQWGGGWQLISCGCWMLFGNLSALTWSRSPQMVPPSRYVCTRVERRGEKVNYSRFIRSLADSGWTRETLLLKRSTEYGQGLWSQRWPANSIWDDDRKDDGKQ